MKSVPVTAAQIPPPHEKTVYFHPFASRVAGRTSGRLFVRRDFLRVASQDLR